MPCWDSAIDRGAGPWAASQLIGATTTRRWILSEIGMDTTMFVTRLNDPRFAISTEQFGSSTRRSVATAASAVSSSVGMDAVLHTRRAPESELSSTRATAQEIAGEEGEWID